MGDSRRSSAGATLRAIPGDMRLGLELPQSHPSPFATSIIRLVAFLLQPLSEDKSNWDSRSHRERSLIHFGRRDRVQATSTGANARFRLSLPAARIGSDERNSVYGDYCDLRCILDSVRIAPYLRRRSQQAYFVNHRAMKTS